VYRETFATAHRKVDGIEMNIKVPYRLAIFAIIIEILIFEIVLMRARQEKRSSRSRPSMSIIGCWRRVGEARGEAVAWCPPSPLPRLAAPKSSRRYAQSRLQYNETDYNTYNNTAKVG